MKFVYLNKQLERWESMQLAIFVTMQNTKIQTTNPDCEVTHRIAMSEVPLTLKHSIAPYIPMRINKLK